MSYLQWATVQISVPVVFSLSHTCVVQGSARKSRKISTQNLRFPFPCSLVFRDSPPTLQYPWLSQIPSLGSSSKKGNGFFHWSSSQGTGCDACQLQKIKLFSCCSVSDPQVIVCLFVFSSLLFSSVIFCWRLHVLEAYSSKQKWNLQLITLNQQCHKTNLKNALLHLNTPLSCSSLKIFWHQYLLLHLILLYKWRHH